VERGSNEECPSREGEKEGQNKYNKKRGRERKKEANDWLIKGACGYLPMFS
jgi:hypothetical protein